MADAGWFDGEAMRPIRELAAERLSGVPPVLTPGCLSEVDAIAALDDRGALVLPALRPYLRT